MFESLVIGLRGGRILHKLNSRELCFSAKSLNLVVIFFSAIFILVASNQYSVKDAGDSQNSIGSEWISTHSVLQDSFESVCPPSNVLCFPSTLTEAAISIERCPESEALNPSFPLSREFSSELKEVQSKLSFLSHHHDTFRFLGEKTVSCSVYQQDEVHETSHLGKRVHSSKSSNDSRSVILGFFDESSSVPLEIKPSLMDWGNRNLYSSSLAFLTVKNVDADNIFRIYDTYSSSTQFYSCNFSEASLAPGEVTSLCFVFCPTLPGFASAQFVLQTSFGGFLIQAKGFAIESPYLKDPLGGSDLSSVGRLRKELSLFNPFDEVLNVKEIIAWISTSSEYNLNSTTSVCSIENIQNSVEYGILNATDRLVVERVEAGRPEVALRIPKSWNVAPRNTESIVELDISGKGKAVGSFCIKFLRPPNKDIEILVLPFDVELIQNSSAEISHVSSSLDASAPCRKMGSCFISLSVRNDASHVISVIKVDQVGKNAGIFHIRYVEGLVLFPGTVTHVAILSYNHFATHELQMDCKLMILFNDTSSQLEIPCLDIIDACSGVQSNYSVGFTIESFIFNYVNGENEIKVDEMILRNWKSHAAVGFMSVVEKTELTFPKVLIGSYSSRWITVSNPSQEPVIMQLILNPEEVSYNCKRIEMSLQPSSSLGDKMIAPPRYGFSVAKNALTEAVVHPLSSAMLGPILFRPSERCEWRSSALIRNNLSGVEWISLQGFGCSLALAFLEGGNSVRSFEFQVNLQSQLNTNQARPCSQVLYKEIHMKNMGDLLLEVKQIHVSGANCGLDGFTVENCSGFSLQPGESVILHISYKPDFTAVMVKRDLELAMTNGIVTIPMTATIPVWFLDLCKKCLFWIRVKDAILALLLSALLLSVAVFLLSPWITVPVEFIAPSTPSAFPEYGKFSDVDTEPGTETASDATPIENLDVRKTFESHLMVRVRSEKARRRKKKKSPNLDVSSSQSGNSTPSSPLSPISFMTPKRQSLVSPGIRQALKPGTPFSEARLDQTDTVMGKPLVLLPSATWPGHCRIPPSPILTSTSKIAPHARAPGTKLGNNQDAEEKVRFDQKYTYDIWGDRLYDEGAGSALDVSANSESNSESFFIRSPLSLSSSSDDV